MRGKWFGSWKMSKGAEKMLRRMIQPNADLRCTAPDVLQDPYWDASLPVPGHKKLAGSGTPDKSKSHNGVSPLSSRRAFKVQQAAREQTKRRRYDKENSPMTVPNQKKAPARQRVLSGTDGLSLRLLLIADINDPFLVLSLTKRRPNVDAHLHAPPRPRDCGSALKQTSPKVQDKENSTAQKVVPRKTPSARGVARKPSALGDRTTQIRNAENSLTGALDKSVSETDRSKGSVRDRMREWELERARLREMERVGESDTPDVEQETERHLPVRKPSRLGDIMPPVPPSPGIVFGPTFIPVAW
jgi:serine/threonine-protein kinase GIN4